MTVCDRCKKRSLCVGGYGFDSNGYMFCIGCYEIMLEDNTWPQNNRFSYFLDES